MKPECFAYTNKITSKHSGYRDMKDAVRAAEEAGYLVLDVFTQDPWRPNAWLTMLKYANAQKIAAIWTPSLDNIDDLYAARRICAVATADTRTIRPKSKAGRSR